VYSTCLFCHASLGANEVIEDLPIGRRLAFDAAQGRLWVVCRACRRWNLTPIEERWEAIEACERHYRAARVRASTDEIGLARLPEGLELVRVGKPPRAELAAWQYVDVFRRRRRRALMWAGVASAAVVGAVIGRTAFVGVASGIGALVQFGIQMLWTRVNLSVRFPGLDGKPMTIPRTNLSSLEWLPPIESVPYVLQLTRPGVGGGRYVQMAFRGDHAERAIRPILAQLNRYAGRRDEVQQAVSQLNREGDPMANGIQRFGHKPIPISELTAVDRLSFEMSLAELEEQRLLAGELASLSAAWREAEEIASIADNMFLPESVTSWLRRHGR
jgi:hypothetical protein